MPPLQSRYDSRAYDEESDEVVFERDNSRPKNGRFIYDASRGKYVDVGPNSVKYGSNSGSNIEGYDSGGDMEMQRNPGELTGELIGRNLSHEFPNEDLRNLASGHSRNVSSSYPKGPSSFMDGNDSTLPFLVMAFSSPAVTGVLLFSLSFLVIGLQILHYESHPGFHFPYVMVLVGIIGIRIWWAGVRKLTKV